MSRFPYLRARAKHDDAKMNEKHDGLRAMMMTANNQKQKFQLRKKNLFQAHSHL